MLYDNVQSYLRQMPQSEKPLLLGFSGGEDSLALAHCLIRLKIPFHIAHFDHAWRQSSAREAEELKKWAEEQGIPFYTRRSTEKGGDEDQAREERYSFFHSIFNHEALVLAHHRDDQVETILKRVFEGAHLPMLRGIRGACQRGNMPIWRPLLGTSKETIRAYLKENGLRPIDDPTNRDEKYLRARMRIELIPLLEEKFGKKIGSSLIRLGHYSAELEEYLEGKTIPAIVGPFGTMWDFSGAHPIEIRYTLARYKLSKPIMDQLIAALTSKVANHKICSMIADRGHLFFFKAQGGYTVSFGPPIEGPRQNWKNWWQGKISVNIPEGNFSFELPNSQIRKFQNTHKVPAFLRDTLPVLVAEGKPVGEFLSGKSRFLEEAQSVTFDFNPK